MPRTPRSSKAPEQLRRTSRGEPWTVLPTSCSLPVPAWPTAILGKASAQERALWASVWRSPLGALWHAWAICEFVVARYCQLFFAAPYHSSTSRLESDLGLTPAALLRLRLIVEDPQPPAPAEQSRYSHLRVVE